MHANVFSTRNQGSIAIIALLVTAVGTIGLAAMLTLVHARMSQIETAEEAVLRRVRLMNGKQLAKQYVYQEVLPTSAGAEGTYTIGSNWARITVKNWIGSAFTTTTTGEINPFGPSPNGVPFVETVEVDVFSLASSGSWDTTSEPDTYEFRILGRNPALGGTLLSLHRSANGALADNEVDGPITVSGRSLIWESDAVLADRNYEFLAEQTIGENSEFGDSDYRVAAAPSGDPDVAKLMPDNTPFAAWLNYAVVSSVTNTGLLSVVNGPSGNSMTNFVINNGGATLAGTSGVTATGYSNNGSGVTTITLGEPSLPHLILDATHTTVTLEGQVDAAAETAASTLSPVVIVVQGTLLTTINIQRNNARPVILGVRKGFGLGSVSLNIGTGATDVRMILVAEETPMTVDCAGNDVDWEGGVITDRDFVHNANGTLTFIEEDSPTTLDTTAPRWLWVESYLQPYTCCATCFLLQRPSFGLFAGGSARRFRHSYDWRRRCSLAEFDHHDSGEHSLAHFSRLEYAGNGNSALPAGRGGERGGQADSPGFRDDSIRSERK